MCLKRCFYFEETDPSVLPLFPIISVGVGIGSKSPEDPNQEQNKCDDLGCWPPWLIPIP